MQFLISVSWPKKSKEVNALLGFFWPTRQDLNLRPSESESDALSSCATGRFLCINSSFMKNNNSMIIAQKFQQFNDFYRFRIFFIFFKKVIDKRGIFCYNDVVVNIGASPSGKATDSDSVTSGVRIPVPQPNAKGRISVLFCVWLGHRGFRILNRASAVKVLNPINSESPFGVSY